MKKELVIITSTCYPVPSATGSIALRYATYLKERYNIRVICLQSGKEKMWGCVQDGIEIYSISQWRYTLNQIALEQSQKKQGIISKVYRSIYWLTRCIGKIQAMFFFLDNRWWYKNKAFCALKKLNDEKKIDAILSVSAPIQSHFAALRFKEIFPETLCVCYFADLFSGTNYNQNIFVSKSKRKDIERRIIEKADKVLVTEEIYFVYQQYGFTQSEKIVALPYTMNEEVLRQTVVIESAKNKNVICCCMGSLNTFMRDPRFMLEVFSDDSIKSELHLYTSGCEEQIDKYKVGASPNIISHGRVPYNELVQALMNSHILVNIGNAVSTSVPSKVLELISFGKPIIDFYYPGQRLELLDSYPIILRIKMDGNVKDARERIERFIKDNSDCRIDKQEIKKQYAHHSEENVKNILLQVFTK